jgi:alanyl aminopeptidase
MPNADGAGYYRWTIGDAALQDIAPGASEILNARERVSFLGNLGALLDAGELGGDTYLSSLEAFASDPEPLVVSAVISELDDVRETFVTPDLEAAFANYIGQTLSPAIERFGIEPKVGEDEAIAGFRPRLLYWLGMIAGEENVVAWAAETTQRYLQAPSSVDPDLAEVALKITAKHGDEALFDVFRERFESAQTPAARNIYLQSLGAFKDPAIQGKALAYALDGPLYANEVWLIPGTVRNAYGGPDRVFNWMASHYDRFSSRLPPVFLPFLPMFGGGCDRERMHEATAFFAQPGVKVEGTEKQMKKVEASVLDCISLREREKQRVADYLGNR